MQVVEQLLGRAQSLCVQNNPGSSILNALGVLVYWKLNSQKRVSWSSEGRIELRDR